MRSTTVPPTAAPDLFHFITEEELTRLIRHVKAEDLGIDGVDVTSEAFIPATMTGEALVRVRQPGRLAGLALLPWIAAAYDDAVTVDLQQSDGHALDPSPAGARRGSGSSPDAGGAIAELAGPMRSILALERVALNFIAHLSGIATLTARYVKEVHGTAARIYDTRKTLPGLRGLQKYAVACGGGMTHRMGLHDAMLIKDNHLAHVPLASLKEELTASVQQARRDHPNLTFIEVEVDTDEQLELVLTTGVDLVLLDNMNTDQLRQAAAVRDRLAPDVELEASGNVNLATVQAIARTGVDRISVGALTHSAPALDVGLEVA